MAACAPIAEDGGYAWFANRGICRPVPGRPVVLIGFRRNQSIVGARRSPAAWLRAAAFEAGLPTAPGRLAGLPVGVAQGEHDTVIRRELLDRTWTCLLGPSGARALDELDTPAGHQIVVRAGVGRAERPVAGAAEHPAPKPPSPRRWRPSGKS